MYHLFFIILQNEIWDFSWIWFLAPEFLIHCLCVLLLFQYLVYDTQIMMGGGKMYSISPEEYIFAALNLYLDIVNLFLYILQLVSAAKGNWNAPPVGVVHVGSEGIVSSLWDVHHCSGHVNVFRTVFNYWVLEVILWLLWFSIATLCDWLKNLIRLAHSLKSETKTNCGLPAHGFSRLALAACICFDFWLVYWISCICL